MKTVRRIADLFAGLNRAHGIYSVTGKNTKKGKITGKARTLKEPVTLDKWSAHLKGETGLGIVPIRDDGTVVFAAVDIDEYTINAKKVYAKIVENKLPLIPCRSKSGGIHLYVFFKKPVQANLVRDALIEWAISIGYPRVEIFPKQSELAGEDDVGSWINIPYFNAKNTDRYALDKNGEAISLTNFLTLAEESKIVEKDLEYRITRVGDEYSDGPPCLQHLVTAGFPIGTRNRALFNLGVFLKMKYGDTWKSQVEQINTKLMHPPLASSEVQSIIKSLGRKSYFFTCHDDPIASVCNRSVCQGRKYGIGGTSRDPGVTIDGLSKITTDPPTWFLNVDGKRLRIDSTEDLISQTRFAVACVNGHNIFPQKVDRTTWEGIVRDLLEKVEEIEAPHDASIRGQFEFLFEQFCAESVPARNKEDLLLGRLWLDTETNRTYFRSMDLMAYLERHRVKFAPRLAWEVLREQGANSRQFKLKGRVVRCWGVKNIARQTDPHDTEEPDETPY